MVLSKMLQHVISTGYSLAAEHLPNGVRGVRFREVDAFGEIECFIKEVLDL